MIYRISFLLVFGFICFACSEDQDELGSQSSGEWSIPFDQVFDGGPGKDGIPSVDAPELIAASEATFLNDNELIVGYADENSAVAYAHQILDWHEIINHEVNDNAFAVTYCPLTGTAVGWDRVVDGQKTTFGVSGLLYNTNLIPYDRKTDSNWSQILSETVNGELIGKKAGHIALVETTWKTWKEMYPETQVVSTNTGFRRSYGQYPYGDYRTNSRLIFPVNNEDDRLPRKERVHGIIIDKNVKTYRFTEFETRSLIKDTFRGQQVVVVGDKDADFIVSFNTTLNDGEIMEFELADPETDRSVILTDSEGNSWDIFGYAVKGPRKGQRLKPTESYIGYWFSWGAFYPGTEIYNF